MQRTHVSHEVPGVNHGTTYALLRTHMHIMKFPPAGITTAVAAVVAIRHGVYFFHGLLIVLVTELRI